MSQGVFDSPHFRFDTIGQLLLANLVGFLLTFQIMHLLSHAFWASLPAAEFVTYLLLAEHWHDATYCRTGTPRRSVAARRSYRSYRHRRPSSPANAHSAAKEVGPYGAEVLLGTKNAVRCIGVASWLRQLGCSTAAMNRLAVRVCRNRTPRPMPMIIE